MTNLDHTIQLLTQLQPHLTDTIQELQLNQHGYPTNTSSTGTTPTLNPDGKPAGLDRYLNQPDPAAQDLTTLKHTITQLHHHTLQLHRIITTWTSPTTPQQLTRGADCLACTRYVPNTDTDRIRSGLCATCHRSLLRSQQDRGEWLLQRRKQQHPTGDGDNHIPTQPIQHKGTSAIATNQTGTL